MALADFHPPDTSDPPFAVPPDMVLDVPVPPSVNTTRKVHWPARKIVEEWQKQADMSLIYQGQYKRTTDYLGRFELTIILDEKQCNLDADNPIKSAVDYLKRLELITDDSKKYMRKLTVEWGVAPRGCRIILRPSA